MQTGYFTDSGAPISTDMLRLGSQIGRCARCRRPLSDPVSVAAGMGPICRSIGRGSDRSQTGDCHDLPWDAQTGDIRLERRCDGIHTNLPIVIAHHSPTGVEWSYGGSGPADPALSILAAFIPGDGKTDERVWSGQRVSAEAYELHQAFKQQFIAPLPHEGGRISGEAIRAWIEEQRYARLCEDVGERRYG